MFLTEGIQLQTFNCETCWLPPQKQNLLHFKYLQAKLHTLLFFTESGRIRYNFVQFSVTRKTYLLLNHVVPRKEQLIICHDFEIKYFPSDLCFRATVKFPSDHLTTTFLKAHSSDYRAKFYATLSKKIDSN